MSFSNHRHQSDPPPPLPPRKIPLSSPPLPPRPAAQVSTSRVQPPAPLYQPYDPRDYMQASGHPVDSLTANISHLDVNPRRGPSPHPDTAGPSWSPPVPYGNKPTASESRPPPLQSNHNAPPYPDPVVHEPEPQSVPHISVPPPPPRQSSPYSFRPPPEPAHPREPELQSMPPPPPRQSSPYSFQPTPESFRAREPEPQSVPQIPIPPPQRSSPYSFQPPPESSRPRENPTPSRPDHGRQSSTSSRAPLYEPPLSVAIPVSQLAVKHNSSPSSLRLCPYPEPLSFSALWYYPSCSPGFLICSNCFEKTIRPARSCDIEFKSFVSTAGEKKRCSFGTPRVESLWKAATQSNSWQHLRTFMQHRADITSCYGVRGTDGTTGVKWFQMANKEVEGFVSCQACYEDHILATTFGCNFKEHKEPQPANQAWACDVALGHISRAMKHYSDLNDWRGFVQTTSHRLKVPACTPYQAVLTQSTKWYQPKGPLPYFVICEACYLDILAISSMDVHFQPKPASEVQKAESWICTMGNFPMSVAIAEAVTRDKFRLWFECARIFITENLCTGNAVKDGSWYIIKDGEYDFDLCASCYACLIQPFGLDKHFVKAKYPAGNERACDFYPRGPRFAKRMEALLDAMLTGRFEVLKDLIKAYEGVVPCQRLKLVTGGYFWGNADISCCGECYHDVIRGTKLDTHITVRNQYHQRAICDMYSARMRRLWAEACEKDDYASFAAFARHRTAVYHQTVPECHRILQQQRIALSQQRMHNATSNFYNFLDSSAGNRINYTGLPYPLYKYTAADVPGSYSSTFGIEGARYGQKAHAVVHNTLSGAARFDYLEALWLEVE
ncbi:integral membrane protein [Phlyctema vagabunda]|uniref:Integral membrane protein n=1 Tax=Phlyctema vagabunda TaxID=108571 RepID=A0ABR4PBC7_9HELO